MKRYTDFEVWIGPPATPNSAGRPKPILCGSRSRRPDGQAVHWRWIWRTRISETSYRSYKTWDLICQAGRHSAKAVRSVVPGQTGAGRLDDKPRPHGGGEADGLRLRLWIDVPQVAALPWELMNEEGRGFVATAANLALSRYLPVPEPPVFAVKDKLRILVVVESPSNLPQIEDKEVDTLRGRAPRPGQHRRARRPQESGRSADPRLRCRRLPRIALPGPWTGRQAGTDRSRGYEASSLPTRNSPNWFRAVPACV